MFCVGITAVFWLLLTSAYSINASQHFPLTSRLGAGRILEGNIVRTADLNYPKGYSISDVCPDEKYTGKEDKGRATTTLAEALLLRKWQDIAC